MKNGFTLIELLVVVLIIGILAAVALPKYLRTAERTRAVRGLTMVKALGDSARRYYLENGSYPQKFQDFDIFYTVKSLSTSMDAGYERALMDNSDDLWIYPDNILFDRNNQAQSSQYRYIITYCYSDGSIWCGTRGAKGNNKDNTEICVSLGGKAGTPPAGCQTYRDANYKLSF
ncbi:MAG: prepilin-type N-terminal cleavage/methylation domain-containing protein [Elusimicrobium sp.]|jgi:type II secretion system protein G|nr:prepilin-type N-terminal cleavage/methylation domain-containing protein [Elusimicrobium sp.]